MIPRLLLTRLKTISRTFPVVVVTGPRQSGKTTLAKTAFPEKPYVSLEDLDTREFATSDPRGFLGNYPHGAIFDEVQRVPALFSYLQGIVDNKKKMGLYVLTGSQQFLLDENISQSLAGRVNLLKLLPFSLEEISETYPPLSIEDVLLKGMYPALYDRGLEPGDWYPSYIQTYLERDVRLIKNITNLGLFQKFMKMCAARTGLILNLSSLATDCGISHVTANHWLSVLEASYILFLLQPHFQNFNKRLIKAPKLHFYDTGLACSLLRIEDKKTLETHSLKGAIFETFVVSEMVKRRTHKGLEPNVYYWRDKTGHEIDCLIEQGETLIPIEIKSGKTITSDFFANMDFWGKLARQKVGKGLLVYGGNENQKREGVDVIGWRSLPLLGD